MNIGSRAHEDGLASN